MRVLLIRPEGVQVGLRVLGNRKAYRLFMEALSRSRVANGLNLLPRRGILGGGPVIDDWGGTRGHEITLASF